MEKFKQKIPRWVWLLGVIVAIGIFFRVYNHYDFLRFNPDQSRDASLAQDVLDGKESWPLLGPKAGGTEFRLGPAFYYFQIASAKIFGSTPDKMAYPDLLTSILSIPLLYFFLRKFFDRKISLATVGIFAVSFYAVKYARFAWNPNSLPFYVLVFLYALLKLSEKDNKKKWVWALLAGAAAGIAMQLHSLILFSLPIFSILYFAYLTWKKKMAWKWAPLIILIALIFNFPQIASEFQTGGKNVQSFFQGMDKKTSRSGSLTEKFILDATCHIQANSFMILPVGSDSGCDFADISKNIRKNDRIENFIFLADMFFAFVFCLGGYFLLFRFWKKEENEDRKNFLVLCGLWAGILFLILVPLANEISLRFFLAAEFIPFVFIGLWIKFFKEIFPKWGTKIMAIIVATMMATNVVLLLHNFSYLAGHAREGSNGFEEITLGEVGYMANFIAKHSVGATKIYLDGKPGELFKITKSIKYFATPQGFSISNLSRHKKPDENSKVFYIDVVKNPDGKNEPPENSLEGGSCGRVRVYEMGT